MFETLGVVSNTFGEPVADGAMILPRKRERKIRFRHNLKCVQVTSAADDASECALLTGHASG